MTYELAKELKEAGFSFRAINAGICVGDQECFDFCPDFDASKGDSFETQCHFFAPTLSELIQACGENFKRLDYVQDMNMWMAYPVDSFLHDNKVFIEGATSPEEAVAHLFLALNKKV